MTVIVAIQGLSVAIFISEISELRKKIRVLHKAIALQNSKYRDSNKVRKTLSFDLLKEGDYASAD
jgi:hypothetical protein